MSFKIKIMMGVIPITLIIIFILTSIKQTGDSATPPFEVLSERKVLSLGTNTWKINIYLPPKYYSKENLDHIFRSYTKKYSDVHEKLKVNIYTNKENYQADINEPLGGTVFSSEIKTQKVFQDASFNRDGIGGPLGFHNEWYWYKSDLKDDKQTLKVAMKGRAPSVDKEVLETREVTKNDFKIRIVAYNLKDVEPQGTYYTFEFVNDKFLSGSREIMTFRSDELVTIPNDQVKILNDQIGFIYMGWLFAVSVDGGNSWSIWDAERNFSNWQCCNRQFIEEVTLAVDGTGIMKINPIKHNFDYISELYTNDYGKHWNVK